MIKCKGCSGQIDYNPIPRVRAETPQRYYYAGPALVHDPEPACAWFMCSSAAEIVAYIEINRAAG